MPVQLDRALRACGTRFLLYPQAPVLPGYEDPETVWLSPPAGSIGPGPSDDRMYVVDPIGKRELYQFPYLPPYRGPAHPPVPPGPDGHFDHVQAGTRAFFAAHMYGSVRRVLDIWEGYFGRRTEWQFARDLGRLELIPLVDWDNAHSGYGFVETGLRTSELGVTLPFCLSFDVLAHEIGHSILFAEIGVPVAAYRTAEFLAFHEAAADSAALIAVLHFDRVVERLLERTRGNLYVPSVFNRIGELSETEQIRVANNTAHMAELEGIVRLDEHGDWVDDAGLDRQAHELGQPLTGAIFDILVDLFEVILVERNLFSPELDRLVRNIQHPDVDIRDVEALSAAAYADDPGAFKEALLEARDLVGYCLADSWDELVAEGLDFDHVAAAIARADHRLTGGRHAELICSNFRRRGIDPGRRRADTPGWQAYRARRARARHIRQPLPGLPIRIGPVREVFTPGR
jgi:hypothetical protein